MDKLKLIECPRDAMQGLHEFIPTHLKISYINLLLKCGFDTIDFGSFVSPKAIPQMRDTATVLTSLELNDETKLLAIVANERGAEDACSFDEINYLGFPFSVSEEFQRRNTNASIEESLGRVEAIRTLCLKHSKQLVIYLSMGFGNPYGEEWSVELVEKWATRLYIDFDIRIQAVSDTIGIGDPSVVTQLMTHLISVLPKVDFGAHLHTRPESAIALLEAAYAAGCRRFDGALKGFGGCPMAKDDLTGNMPTERMLEWFDQNNITTGVDMMAFREAFRYSGGVFAI
jgi:hydroxymethylglutaryl-CoA lyase